MKKIIIFVCVVFISAALFTSCLGAAADITIRADGSGKIALEYRVSQMLEEIGRLDGNESRPTIPVGKKDFQRTAQRIPGLSLSSYSSKEVGRLSDALGAHGKKDLVTKAVLKFKNTDALLAFLDGAAASGGAGSATLTQNGEKNTLRLVLLEPSADSVDADLLSLMREVSAGYEMRFTFNLPKNASLSVIPPSVQPAQVVSSGKKVSAAFATGDLLSVTDGAAVEITW